MRNETSCQNKKDLIINELSRKAFNKKVESLQLQIDDELAQAIVEFEKFNNDICADLNTVSTEMTEINVSNKVENLLEFANFYEFSKLKNTDKTSDKQILPSDSINMTLSVGPDKSIAHIKLDSNNGIEINIQDLILKINTENGCSVHLKNGMNFTIPLSISDFEIKKKAS